MFSCSSTPPAEESLPEEVIQESVTEKQVFEKQVLDTDFEEESTENTESVNPSLENTPAEDEFLSSVDINQEVPPQDDFQDYLQEIEIVDLLQEDALPSNTEQEDAAIIVDFEPVSDDEEEGALIVEIPSLQNEEVPLPDEAAPVAQEDVALVVETVETEAPEEEPVLAETEGEEEPVLAETELAQDAVSVELDSTVALEQEDDSIPEEINETQGVLEDIVVPSRSVVMDNNQYLDIRYPGSGWVYLGEVTEDGSSIEEQNLTYFGRRRTSEDTSFTMKASKPGKTILHFYKQDILTATFIDDYLEVTITEAIAQNGFRVIAPSYESIVPGYQDIIPQPKDFAVAEVPATEPTSDKEQDELVNEPLAEVETPSVAPAPEVATASVVTMPEVASSAPSVTETEAPVVTSTTPVPTTTTPAPAVSTPVPSVAIAPEVAERAEVAATPSVVTNPVATPSTASVTEAETPVVARTTPAPRTSTLAPVTSTPVPEVAVAPEVAATPSVVTNPVAAPSVAPAVEAETPVVARTTPVPTTSTPAPVVSTPVPSVATVPVVAEIPEVVPSVAPAVEAEAPIVARTTPAPTTSPRTATTTTAPVIVPPQTPSQNAVARSSSAQVSSVQQEVYEPEPVSSILPQDNYNPETGLSMEELDLPWVNEELKASDELVQEAVRTENQQAQDALLAQAQDYFYEEDYPAALASLDEFFEIAVNDFDAAYYLKGQILESKSPIKNVKEAQKAYKQVIDSYPQSPFWERSKNRYTYLSRFYFDIR